MTQVTKELRHSKRNPCPVCGGGENDPRGQSKRCTGFTSEDGDWTHCSREEHAGAIAQNGAGLFAHLMKGPCNCGQTHRDRPDDIEATYDYIDESGALLFQVVRKAGKQFRQRKPDGAGGWDWKTAGVRRVLYRLSELADSETVYICEGEKDVDNARRWDLVATCNPGGAEKWHFVAEMARGVLAGKKIVIFPDDDKPGQRHAQQVAAALKDFVASVKVVPLPGGKDFSDFQRQYSAEKLRELTERAPEWVMTDSVIRQIPRPDDSEGEEHTGTYGSAGPTLPEVKLGPDVHRVIDEIINIIKGDDAIYSRAYELVTIVGVDKTDRKAALAVGTPTIRPHTVPSVLPRLTKRIQFLASRKATKDEQLDASRGGKKVATHKPAQPPANIIHSFLSLGDWPGIRPIVGVTETPILRPDGKICQKEGYDDATGYVLMPNAIYPTIAESPTQDQARDCLRQLLDVFADFPYVDDASRMVPVAAILTVMARSAIAGAVPAFVFDASVRGSGKTMQADIVSIIATGRSAARTNYPEDDDELAKMLSSFALCGAPLFLIDNVTRPFGGGPLDLCITAVGDVEFRVLGKTEIRRIPWLAVILASGNNVVFPDDTVRRVLVSRLESLLESPETREDFTHQNLPKWVRDNRPHLVACALTILRAYCAHEKPNAGCPRWGSFEAWSELIPHAIVFAGGVDVMGARPKGERAMTDDLSALATFLRELTRLDPAAKGLSPRDIIQLLYPNDREDGAPDGWELMREAIETWCPPKYGTKPSADQIGKRLARYDGRILGGRRLQFRMLDGRKRWLSIEVH
jgi:putative DNA primase/helicase